MKKEKSERKDINYYEIIDSRLTYWFHKTQTVGANEDEKIFERLYKISRCSQFRRHFNSW